MGYCAMTARALIREADILRALRAARKLGAVRVTITKDGAITFDMPGAKDVDKPPDEAKEPRGIGSLW